MNPELSRRVAKIMHTPAVIGLGLEGRFDFVSAVEKAGSFDALPDKYKKVVVAGELELTGRTTITVKRQPMDGKQA